MSNPVKALISIVAAIAIPFAAPAIAASIGLSATVGAVAGSAIVGAGLGAAKAAVFNEDVGKGALYGGLGGGIGGYTAGATAAPSPYDLTSAGTTAGTTAAAPFNPMDFSLNAGLAAPTAAAPFSPTDFSLTGGSAAGGGFTSAPATFSTDFGLSAGSASLSPTFNPMDFSLNAGALPTGGLNPATASYGLQGVPSATYNAGVSNALATGQPVDYGLNAYGPSSGGLNVESINPATGGIQTTTGAGTYQTPMAPTSANTFQSPAQSQQLPSASSESPSMFDKIKKVPGVIADKLTNPEYLADLTLRAAGMLAGSAAAGDGLSDEERALVEQQRADLENLRNTNRSLFDQRLEQAQNLMGESKYFDPEYFGLQRARRAQLAGAKAKKAGLRGLEGGARLSEGRRFDLATARDTGTAYDQGYGTGVQGRLGTMQAGMQMMPSAYPSAAAEYRALQDVYGNANERRRTRQKDVGNLFGSLTA